MYVGAFEVFRSGLDVHAYLLVAVQYKNGGRNCGNVKRGQVVVAVQCGKVCLVAANALQKLDVRLVVQRRVCRAALFHRKGKSVCRGKGDVCRVVLVVVAACALDTTAFVGCDEVDVIIAGKQRFCICKVGYHRTPEGLVGDVHRQAVVEQQINGR